MGISTHLGCLVLVLAISTPLAFAKPGTLPSRRSPAGPALTSDSKCGCFKTNGSDVAFFQKHRFFDFRDLQQYQGVPPAVTDEQESTDAPETSAYFTDKNWTDMWQIQVWNNSNHVRTDASVTMINSKSNVYIEANNGDSAAAKTWLTLRTQRLPNFQTAATINSMEQDIQFVSMRMLARTIGGSGGCTAMFTYKDDGHAGNVQEADLEILTKDPRNSVQYTNQPSVDDQGNLIDGSTQNTTLPNGQDWTAWVNYRLDWTPKQSTWYVDGQEASTLTFQTPRDPSNVIFQAWSDGGNWTGNMTLYDSVYLQIQWIDLVYNTSSISKRAESSRIVLDKLKGRSDQNSCASVCSIDETPSTGQPVLLWSSGAFRPSGPGAAAWIPFSVVVALFLMSLGLL